MLDLLTPLLAVVLTIYVKCVSRSDLQFFFRREDFAVGLEIAVVAVLTFAAAPTNNATLQRAAMTPWLVLGMVLAIWATSAWIRKYGWDADGRLRLVRGIVLPNLVGLGLLFGVVMWLRT